MLPEQMNLMNAVGKDEQMRVIHAMSTPDPTSVANAQYTPLAQNSEIVMKTSRIREVIPAPLDAPELLPINIIGEKEVVCVRPLQGYGGNAGAPPAPPAGPGSASALQGYAGNAGAQPAPPAGPGSVSAPGSSAGTAAGRDTGLFLDEIVVSEQEMQGLV